MLSVTTEQLSRDVANFTPSLWSRITCWLLWLCRCSLTII